ncbi:MAG: FAD-binding oxidoreductase [Magnetovibrio sp.]|nr:FAD-binding oxidoreductase [Magnetovibrio sp.]
MNERYDIVIIGGAIVGSSIAYFLTRGGRGGEVAVIEPDPTYEWAATPRSQGGVRQIFSLPENIAMGAYGLEFYSEFEESMAVDGEPQPISFNRGGYLFVSDNGGHEDMERNYHTQRDNGANVELLDAAALRDRFPSIQSEDVVLGVHSPDDGWLDPYAAMMGFRKCARHQGVTYVADKVVGWEGDGGLARRVTLESGAVIEADTFVLAAGAWSGELGELIGFELPVEPLSRDCYHFKCEQELEPLPLIKTEKDLGIRPEPDGFSGGLPDWRRGPGWSFNEVGGFFEETFWPLLAELMPAFETLKLLNTWQGHYARNHFDLTAIIGPWSGGMENVYVATGYSGHGIMQAPATGRAIAELILDGGFQTLDLTNMGYARVPANKPYREQGII